MSAATAAWRMHLLNGNSSKQQLTNFEVLQHVNAAKSTTRSENLQTIVVELQAYLRERPAGNSQAAQSEANLKAFMENIARFKLEKTELLQIINSAPNSMPILFCLIEEADTRFSDEELEEILAISEQYLGEEPIPGGDE